MSLSLVHKIAVETPDSVLKDFNTPTPYEPTTVVYVLNGRSHTLGWTELGGTLVRLVDAPQIGDVVSFWYTQL